MAQSSQLEESQPTSKQDPGASASLKKCNMMNCPSCDYSSTNKHYLRQHIDLVHSTEKPFKCPFCDYAGKRSHSLKEHLIVHSDERPFKCSHCNAKFRKKGHLTNHNRMHAESQTTPTCLLCKTGTVSFSSHDELYLHLRSVHANRRDTSVFCCNRCNYATTVKGNLQIHEMGHNDYRHVVLMKPKLPPSASIILKCSDCGFETSQRHELEEHVMMKHYDAKGEEGFTDVTNNNNLSFQKLPPTMTPRSRVGSHLTVTPKYKCSECGYVTGDEKQLLAHALRHSYASKNMKSEAQNALGANEGADANAPVDGSYVCTICNYFCDTQRTLKAHMWKHLGHKNLQYPTFQNGPLSVYDGTPLAAKNFVRRSSSDAQQSPVAQAPSENNASSLRNMQGWTKDVESHNETASSLPGSSGGSPTSTAPFPKRVVVQSIQRVSDMNTTSRDIEVNEESLAAESVAAGRTDIENSNLVNDGNSSCTDGDVVEGEVENEEGEIAIGAKKIDTSGYSATEQTAATLLSLLRQGPNVNPACPPPGYYAEMREAMEQPEPEAACGSDSAIVDDVAGEEVVGTASVSSSPPSDIQSAGKPKQGICSSLLAVIEQLRQRQTEESTASGIQSLRKRKHVSTSEEVEDAILMSNGEAGERRRGVIDSNGVVYRYEPFRQGRNLVNTPPVKDTKDKTGRQAECVEIEVCPTNMNSVLDADQVLAAAHSVVYRCKLCHYRSSSHLMRQHMKVHKKKKPHECSLCDFVASSTSLLQDHMIQHCKMRQFQCKLCSAVFNYKSQLRAHTRVHEDGQAFYCEHCEYVTSYLDCFQEHLNQHSETITSFTCIACRQTFSDLVKLQRHMKESCMEVKKLYKTNPLVTSQPASIKASDPTSRTLKCDQCEFVALSTRSLKSHLKRHINDKRYIQQPLEQYKCNLCGYVCHHMPSLKSHMWRHANDSDFSYSFNDLLADTSKAVDKKGKPLITLRCCQCGYETLQKAELDKHMKRHWDIIKKTYDVGSVVGSPD